MRSIINCTWCNIKSFLFLLAYLSTCNSSSNTRKDDCEELYRDGVDAYLENRFDDCVQHLEEALDAYHRYTRNLIGCRLYCNRIATDVEPLAGRNIENLHFFEKAVRNTLCLVKCRSGSGDMPVGGAERMAREELFNIGPDVVNLFEAKKPYEYLQACYNQTGQLDKVASAAFTYLAEHPEDVVMQANLKYYSEQAAVDMNNVINHEAKDYVYLYVHGASAYERKDWSSVVHNMEESLLSYLQSEEECRALCEGPFNQGWYPDFIPAISNHFTYCLRCKQNCSSKLNSLNGERHDDLLPSHYHFLQYAYFKLGNIKEACSAVSSYLLFYPLDESMLHNMKYYSSLPKVEKKYFSPRQESLDYIERREYETRILKFIFTEFKYDQIYETNNSNHHHKNLLTAIYSPLLHRIVVDDMLSSTECSTLVDAVKNHAITGDGYTSGKPSPHTQRERFEGLSVLRAATLTRSGLMDTNILRLLLGTTSRIKAFVERTFGIYGLYSTYTHLVGRSALPDSESNDKFSHAIHADNCNLREDGQCDRKSPAYIWRDYSVIIYLNDDFIGGEFIFTKDLKGDIVESTVKPKCGRVVAFSSGHENIHGVRAVTKGSRFALGLWFTFSPEHADVDRSFVNEILH